MPKTKAALAEVSSEIVPGSFRHEVLETARRFKSTWFELGKRLAKVRDEALFEGWGYRSFEAYCQKEIRIRKSTADKLTRTFAFVARHEPELARNDDPPPHAPAFEVVEVLASAEDRGQLSAQEYRSIRDSIWNPESSQAQLRRELTDRFPRPPEPEGTQGNVRRLAQAARRLAQELGASRKVPAVIAERASALADDLEELAASDGPGD
jgi:hypothetical protein